MMLWNHVCLLFLVWFASLQTTKAMFYINQQTNGSNPEFQTIMFDESKSFRQDMCYLHSQYYKKEIDLADALKGLNLSSVFECPNLYCNMKGEDLDPDDPGIFVILLDEIADRAGFNWRDNYALTDPNRRGDKTFDDLLAWSVETYDIAVSWWTETTGRIREGIDFPKGWYEADIILVGKIENENGAIFEFGTFLLPFTPFLWTMILVTIIVSGLIHYLLEVLHQRSDRRTYKKSPSENIFLTFVAVTHHFEFQPPTKAAWVFTMSLAFWAMIVASSYTANLASAFVVKNSPGLQVHSIDDAVAYGYKICVWGSTAADTILTRNFRNGIFIRKGEEKGALQGVLNGECKFAAIDKGSWDTNKQDPAIGCELEWIGRKYKEIPAGFATRHDSGTQCSSLISEVLSIHFRDMLDNGFVKRAWEDHLQKIGGKQTCLDETNEEDSVNKQRLTLKVMGGIFIVHGLVSIFVVAYTLISKDTCAAEKYDKHLVKNVSVLEKTEEYADNTSDHEEDKPLLSCISQLRYEMERYHKEQSSEMREMRREMGQLLENKHHAAPAASVTMDAVSYDDDDGIEC